MSTTMKELRSFMSGYFHEDWTLEAADTKDVLDQYLKSNPSPREIDRIVEQIQAYMSSKPDGGDVERALLSDLGCYYLPSADGIDARAWLLQVVQLLKGT